MSTLKKAYCLILLAVLTALSNSLMAQEVLPDSVLTAQQKEAVSVVEEATADSIPDQEVPILDINALERQASAQGLSADSLKQLVTPEKWIPNPTKATWLALVIPGGGQIYNRKYWKLPIFYGGFAGCAYALTWNSRMYSDYAAAYKDAVYNNWDAKSITDLIPENYLKRTSKTQITDLLKKRKDLYRRYKDMSIAAFVAVYLLSVVDAYIDAELSNFDISPDLTMRIQPATLNAAPAPGVSSTRDLGVSCSLSF